ncbi:MAG: hypothetical protein VX068_03270 [Candidatus Thermoplasmatota archaeon]|nr:hypothetical protein [Candidatus Thermoplasmatota archaeon]
MSDELTVSASDIEVDEAAAYFGATESSEVLHAMMAMPREQAMIQFFELLSDIVLRPGDFDFEAASERMQCEGGEIYYLVAGHLGLMSMPDPLLQALGLPDSSGETAAADAGIADGDRAALERLADPMRMMKLFAVAHQTGSKDEVVNYINGFEGFLKNVGGSVPALVSISTELDAALDVAGHVLPIATLASGSATAATVDVPETTSLPAPVETAPPAAAPPEPEVASDLEPATVPLPTTPAHEPAPAPATPSTVALPASTVALPEVAPVPEEEVSINIESEKQVAKATQDAFSGAFSSELVPEPEPVPASETAPEETEFVSAAEHFIAADEDGSGALDVEELAQATGTSLEEASALHAEADTDGDGVVTLSEFIASPAAEKTASLPKPVAPVRRPLAQRPAPTQPQAQPAQPPPQPQPWQQQPPQQAWPQQRPQQQGWQQPPQQQGWPRPQAPLVQPTIRSGVHCRGCGIGLDPYWRFCPVCGQQNLGY